MLHRQLIFFGPWSLYHLVLFSSLCLLLIHSGTVSVFSIFQHLEWHLANCRSSVYLLGRTNLLIIYDSADFLLNIFSYKIELKFSACNSSLLVLLPLLFYDYYHEITECLYATFIHDSKTSTQDGPNDLQVIARVCKQRELPFGQKRLIFYAQSRISIAISLFPNLILDLSCELIIQTWESQGKTAGD